MSQTFKTEEDYVRFRMNSFKFTQSKNVCDTFHEEGDRPSVGYWLIDEGYFSEKEYSCQPCLDASIKAMEEFFKDPSKDNNHNVFICEDCEVEIQRWVKNDDGSISDHLYVHKDVEDKTLTDCCKSCYSKRKKADAAFWSDY